ncbi:hypothetical protein QUA40_27400 [Microcoleus sp. Pol11C3]|uniref:hypothetical protein n=1 Tax=Microcoleus sp. Pol11C3 TaxID=3055390 RepID=UPI002FD30184
MNKTQFKFRLRNTLIIPFLLQTFAAVGLVGYLSFRNGEKAVIDLATQLNNQVNNRISQQLNNYLTAPRQVNEINLKAIDMGILNPQDMNVTRQFFAKQMKLFKNFSYVIFCNQQGLYIGIGRENDGSLYTELMQPSDNFRYKHYALNQQGNPTKLLSRDYYRYQEDPLFEVPVKIGKPTWTSQQ